MINQNQDESWSMICEAYDQYQFALARELIEIHITLYPEHVSAWGKYGGILIELKQFDDAKKIIEKTIELVSDSEICWAYALMGDLYKEKGGFEDSIFWYKKAIEYCPEEATFWIYVGLIYMRQGELKEAEINFTQGTRCRDGYTDEAYFNLAMVKMCQARYQEAEVYLKKALEIDPDYEHAHRKIKEIRQCLALKT